MTLIDKARTQESPPLWLMRQAGRYLPEYRKIRQNYPGFLDFCYSQEDAAKVTLQPIERFGFDAAIIFSDILVIPDALGQKVDFVKGEGPKLGPLDLDILSTCREQAMEHLSPVFRSLGKVRSGLPQDMSLIGFCGAPWTVLTYMIEGGGSKDHAKAKTFAAEDLERFDRIILSLAEVSADYLIKQVEAGADTLQVFDSWAGSVPSHMFERWVIKPMKHIVERVKGVHPHVAIIGFPKGAGVHLSEYAKKTGVDGVGLDYSLPLSWVTEVIPEPVVLQGNLDPAILVAGGEVLEKEVETIHYQMRHRPYIFNLGHGILQQTPIPHVEALVKQVRGLRR